MATHDDSTDATVLPDTPADGITPLQKMYSACAGAVLTSLLTTPLDLVKTRLQSQAPAAGLPCEMVAAQLHQFPRTPSPLGALSKVDVCFCTVPSRRALTCFWRASTMGSNQLTPSTTTAAALEFPAMGQGPTTWTSPRPVEPRPVLRGTLDGVIQIGRQEGFWGLWRGLSPTLVMSVPTTVIYFVGYDHLREQLGRIFRERRRADLDQYTPFVSGAVARTLSATVISPLELVRTRMQSSASHNLTVVLKGLLTMTRTLGITSLWRGLTPTLWRDVPFSAIYWTVYERFKRDLGEWCGHSTSLSRPLSTTEEFRISFMSGAMSGMLAATLTIPFDVAKTRRQIDLAQRPTAQMESTLELMRRIVQHEGVGALYRGLSARLIKVAPACAIMISSYELGKRFFDSSTFTRV
ncbi:Carrier protein, mitochondrial [Dispira parvispora]|uniref:Carrier protein, mitochondrial n=1 Tax=Dispira parvispora TaxID=1520584 RepID=A0A9W8ARY0_9FUNG|nr:Carrier protein, mitochondrial [Dispira parvispora]